MSTPKKNSARFLLFLQQSMAHFLRLALLLQAVAQLPRLCPAVEHVTSHKQSPTLVPLTEHGTSRMQPPIIVPPSEPLPNRCNVQTGKKCRLADGSLHPAAVRAVAASRARNSKHEGHREDGPRRCLSLLPPGLPHGLFRSPSNLSMSASLERDPSTGKPLFNAVLPMHIPKTAGYSLREELLKRFGLETGHMEEYLVEFTSRWPARPTLTVLRSPRAHALSQYLECRYDDWGAERTANTSFPGGGFSREVGFSRWLDHFLVGPEESDGEAGAFRCYSPWNMQSRYLACRRPPFMEGHPE